MNRVTLPASRRLGLADFARQTVRQAAKDHLPPYAGNLAYQGLLALFPALLALLWLLKVLHATALVETLLAVMETTMPRAASGPVRALLTAVPDPQARGAVTLGAVAAALAALWTMSAAMRGIMQALNAMYGVEEGRPIWRRYPLSLLLAVTVWGLLLGAMALVVLGEGMAVRIAEAAGLGVGFRWVWMLVTWPALVLTVLTAFALVYYYGPDVRQQFRWVSPGAIIAVVLWLLFTVMYSLYVNRLAAYDKLYGALVGIAVLMLYLYGTAFILLLGAEMNQVIELHHPDGKDDGAKVPDGDGRGTAAHRGRD